VVRAHGAGLAAVVGLDDHDVGVDGAGHLRTPW
jgi:hypothetical protein